MSVKLPLGMTCQGRPYKVRMRSVVTDDNGKECHGVCDTEEKKILIEIGMEDSRTIEICLHEWLHGIWCEMGFDEEDLPDILEHMVVVAVSKDMVLNHKALLRLLLQLPGAEAYAKSEMSRKRNKKTNY